MLQTTKTQEPELLVDDHHGIYVAQSFCQRYADYITNMDKVKADFDICIIGPDHEDYNKELEPDGKWKTALIFIK